MVNSLLSEPGILIDETDSYGNTPLHLSLMGSNLCKQKNIYRNKHLPDRKKSQPGCP